MQDVKSVENVDLTTLIVDLGTVQIYTSTVQDLIDNACIEFHIEDLLKAGQRQWKAVMQYVGMHLFPDTKVLKDKSVTDMTERYYISFVIIIYIYPMSTVSW